MADELKPFFARHQILKTEIIYVTPSDFSENLLLGVVFCVEHESDIIFDLRHIYQDIVNSGKEKNSNEIV